MKDMLTETAVCSARTAIEKESLQMLLLTEKAEVSLRDAYPRLIEEEEIPDAALENAASLKRACSNLTRATTRVYAMSDELNARLSDIKKQSQKRYLFSAPPANAAIDLKENGCLHFARGRNLYKLLLLCFLGSFFGVLIEMLWCLLKNGTIESRAGLVWGPFNLVYGIGALLLTYALYPVRNRGPFLSFLGGFFVGSGLEYLCSFAQEHLLGSTSWDYSNQPFNLNGRICLLYSFFWGLLGVYWIKDLYPRLAKLILRIPNRAGIWATWLLTAFFVLNSVVSLLAVARWSERTRGIVAENAFWEMIDEHFPDNRMEHVFANLDFKHEKSNG